MIYMENLRTTMKAKEAATYLGISYWLLLELVKQRKVPCITVGNRKLFRKDSLDCWLNEQEASSLEQAKTTI
ncbi:helix-turn-helix domain-containing protein [Desulfitobacterium hafniense]|uniref:helix-turn-helix domain-containing protein n=1 Tax=Desulfitobacterium hafniense TaxID=49338 RepID=UPI003D00ED33